MHWALWQAGLMQRSAQRGEGLCTRSLLVAEITQYIAQVSQQQLDTVGYQKQHPLTEPEGFVANTPSLYPL